MLDGLPECSTVYSLDWLPDTVALVCADKACVHWNLTEGPPKAHFFRSLRRLGAARQPPPPQHRQRPWQGGQRGRGVQKRGSRRKALALTGGLRAEWGARGCMSSMGRGGMKHQARSADPRCQLCECLQQILALHL